MGCISYYRNPFGDTKNLKGKEFLTASWGTVFDKKNQKSDKGKKSSSSCMTDHNGPLEDVFEECMIQDKKAGKLI